MTQPESNERKLILGFCLLAAIHNFIFSAAFPFFTMIDEGSHFDLVMKYSTGKLPRGLEPVANVSTNYFIAYDSHEYLYPRSMKIPSPSWVRSVDNIAPLPDAVTVSWPRLNYEAGQPPLYYAIGGLWWRFGEACGLAGGHLLYWLRFLNILFVAVLVWLGYLAARTVFPENGFLRIGVPALLAFFPQAAFYSIENDVLSPLCFGAAFILVVKFLRTETPGVGIGVAAGLALAATFLVKMTNLPLLAVSILAILLKIRRLAQAGRLRLSAPSVVAMALCAGLPMFAWMAWCKHAFGDLTGSEGKTQYLGWTHKPFIEWWHHPIFTLDGAWTFLSGLMAGFCQGDFWWRCQPLEPPVTDAIYVITSLTFLALAVWGLLSQRYVTSASQRQALWLGLGCFVAAVAFPGLISIMYDFHICLAPSRDFPFFTAGRTILGVLIPFLMLYLYGLDFLLQSVRNYWVRPIILVGMILFMFVSEIASDWPVFSSQYNWFHMYHVRFETLTPK
jgi:hypothetical protein